MRYTLKVAARSLAKSPTFTIVAVAVLALAIGAGTTIFSVVDAVVLRGLPFDEHDRIAAILSVDTRHATTFGGGSSTSQTYLDWRKLQQSFEGLAMVDSTAYRLKTENGEPADATGQRVTWEFFSAFHAAPMLGREFDAND
jgi:putative ABC transport system permease protein